jgi:hypothetical protein
MRATVQNGVLGLERQLQIFCFLCTNMAALFPFLRWHLRDIQTVAKFCCVRTNMATLLLTFQDGVSGVHKMTRYKDGGLHGKFFNCLKFLEKNTRGSRAQG